MGRKEISNPSMKKGTTLSSHWKLKRKAEGEPFLSIGPRSVFSPEIHRLTPLRPGQPLKKALGFRGKSLKVLDVTAGWGRDAWLMANLGCDVIAVEKNELVFTFLDSLNTRLKKPGCFPEKPAGSLKFILGDSLNYLKHITRGEEPDVIYMDPMFKPNKKSASEKALQILQEITETDDKMTRKLFTAALSKSRDKVIVKQHRREKPFKGPLRHSFFGRAVRFDVFTPSL